MKGISVSVEKIGPTMARALLEGMKVNRRLRWHRVEQIASAIRSGMYNGLNGETVVIDEHGLLIDGQHRLNAIILADTPVSMLVARGVAAKAQETIDQGLARSPGDVLGMNGHESPNGLAAAARWLWVYENDWPRGIASKGSASVTTPVVLDTVKRHPELEVAVSEIRSKFYRASTLMTISIAAFTRLITDSISSSDSDLFFTVLVTGEGDQRTKVVRLLRDKLLARGTKQGRLIGPEVVALTVRVWNAMRDGQDLSKLFISKDPNDPYANVQRFR